MHADAVEKPTAAPGLSPRQLRSDRHRPQRFNPCSQPGRSLSTRRDRVNEHALTGRRCGQPDAVLGAAATQPATYLTTPQVGVQPAARSEAKAVDPGAVRNPRRMTAARAQQTRPAPPFYADIGRILIKMLAAQIRVACAPRAGSDEAIACNWGSWVRAGDQGVPQGADVRASRSDPGFEIYAGLPLACRMASDEIRLLQ